MSKIVLNREQIQKLYKLTQHFKEGTHYTLEEDRSSGIGPSITVRFDLFASDDAQVNITDVSEW
jgi:hypothetical protein